MKHALFLILLFICIRLYSQELNLGGEIGFELTTFNSSKTMTIGGSMEYRPPKAIFSFNMDPFFIINKNGVAFTDPLYLKFILGNKFRICPTFGIFICPIDSYGWILGLGFEYKFKENYYLFLKADNYEGFSKEERTSPGGSLYDLIDHSQSILISFGIKKNIFKTPT